MAVSTNEHISTDVIKGKGGREPMLSNNLEFINDNNVGGVANDDDNDDDDITLLLLQLSSFLFCDISELFLVPLMLLTCEQVGEGKLKIGSFIISETELEEKE
jgi:hypothetical protein